MHYNLKLNIGFVTFFSPPLLHMYLGVALAFFICNVYFCKVNV